MASSKIITGACAVVGALGLVATGAALSNAASPSSAVSAAVGYVADTQAPDGSANPNKDTAITGTELANVKAAVKAKDSAVTVTSARKDPDGSYDVFGTKAGANVMLEVSKDLKTITTNAGGHGGHGPDGGGPGGGGNHTPVTGTELANVKAAVKAKDSAVTVTSARKDDDGSYDVFGTKAGANVRLEVSKDLKTITVDTDNHGGGPRG